MTLTPEDVVNKRFTEVKFREGYDRDEVDDFLDEIVVELRRLTSENDELRQKLSAAEARASGSPASAGADLKSPSFDLPTGLDDVAASASANDLLTLARRLHEEHVREGAQKRDELIAEGHETATRLVSEAENKAKNALAELDKERVALEAEIARLTAFETEYRSRLRSYITDQLSNLDHLIADINKK